MAGFAYQAPATVNVATTSTEILAANTSRVAAVISNDSGQTLYLAVGAAAEVGKGISLPSGSKVEFGTPGGLPGTFQAINGIHGGTGNKAVAVQEIK